jgi:hypothetical protein
MDPRVSFITLAVPDLEAAHDPGPIGQTVLP